MKSHVHCDIDAEKPFIKHVCMFLYAQDCDKHKALSTYKRLRCLNVKGVKWDEIEWNVTLILKKKLFFFPLSWLLAFLSIFPRVIHSFFSFQQLCIEFSLHS